jgi:hypothetical protein
MERVAKSDIATRDKLRRIRYIPRKPTDRICLRPRPPCANVPLFYESQILKVAWLGFLRSVVILSAAVFQAERRISGSAGLARKPLKRC